MLTFERFAWLYRSWQEALSASWQLQVKVFGTMLIMAALALLSPSYLTHSWPFGSPGARFPQEKAVKAAPDSISSHHSNAVPSSPVAPDTSIPSNMSSAPNNLKGTQLCPDPDGDGTLVPCKSTLPSNISSAPNIPAASDNLKGTQLCPDGDGDGTLVPCKASYSIDQFSTPSSQP